MALESGSKLGPYEILGLLGSGGMGEVYRALDERLDREVAVKILPENLIRSDGSLERFKREAKALAALSHPNIVTVHDFHADQEISYTVMELLHGETLRQRLKSKKLTWHETLSYAFSILDGLEAAHSKGVVHRDLKPENIFLTNDNRLKILDFGLARLEVETSGDTKLDTVSVQTQPGTVMGTLGYMSPEQLRGEPVDATTDIFSFGCILYEMINGGGPFTRSSGPETMAAILKEDPAPLETVVAKLPPGLNDIVLRCLKKNRQERFSSAAEVRKQLKALEDGTATTVPHQQPLLNLSSVSLKRYWPAAAAIVLLVLGVVAFLRNRESADFASNERIPIAVADFVNETTEPQLDGLSGMLITSLEQSERLTVLTRSRMLDILKQMGYDKVERIDEGLGKEISRRASVKALILASIRKFGDVYIIDLKALDPQKNEYIFTAKEEGKGQDKIPQMLDELSERTRAHLKEKVEKSSVETVASMTTSNLDAYQYFFSAEKKINDLDFEDAIEDLEKALQYDPEFALAWYRLAYAYAWHHEARAEEPIRQALRYIKKAPPKEQQLIKALDFQIQEKIDEAKDVTRKVVSQYPHEKEALFLLGDLHYHTEEFDSAEMFLKRALEIDPAFPRALQHLYLLYRDIEDKEKMLQAAQNYVEHVKTEESYNFLLQALLYNEKHQEAEKLIAEAETILTNKTEWRSKLVDVRLREGNLDDAEKELEKLDKDERYFQMKTFVRLYQGRVDEARQLPLKALPEMLEKKPEDAVHINLIMATWEVLIYNNLPAAREYYQKANQIPVPAEDKNEVASHKVFVACLLGDFESARKITTKDKWLNKHRDDIVEGFEAYIHQDYAKVEQKFSKVPKSGRALILNYYLSKALVAQGKFDEAHAELIKLQEIQTSFATDRALILPKVYLLLAQISEKQKNPAQAKKYYEQLLTLWKSADQDLPDLIVARKGMQGLT